jgi:DNA-binding transcriptional ArsR family regulator
MSAAAREPGPGEPAAAREPGPGESAAAREPDAGEPAADPSANGHPTKGLDETVHQRHRLGILTITAEAKSADFGYLRDALDLTPGNLSRHLTVLEDAGLIQVTKGYEGRRPRTWVSITSDGRAALSAEIAALTELLRRHGTMPSR